MVAQVLGLLAGAVRPGQTTQELAEIAAAELDRLGGKAAFLGYQGFPSVICISVNEEVVHGLPGARKIADGDLVGFDFGAVHKGMIADGATTVAVGEVTAQAQHLLTATQQALAAGVEAAQPDNWVQDISAAVETVLKSAGLGVIEDLSGHGVGRSLHEAPTIPNFTAGNKGVKLAVGMTLAIEPMATLGGKEVRLAADGSTIITSDGSLAAQFEHTVAITQTGPQILTLP